MSYRTNSRAPYGLIDERVDGQNIRIEVGGKKAERVFVNRVRLWNSGKKPIKDFAVRFRSDTTGGEGFELLSVTHKTKPEVDFGAITEVENTNTSRKIKYELLNSGDGDIASFLSSRKTQINVSAKAEGMWLNNRTKERTNEKTDRFYCTPWVMNIGLIYMSALLALAFRPLFRQKANK